MTETHDHYSPEQQRVFLKRAFDAAQSGEPDMARQLLRALGITDGPATASELNGFIARLYIERTEAYRDGVASQDAASVDLSRGSIPHEILRTAQQGGSSAMLQELPPKVQNILEELGVAVRNAFGLQPASNDTWSTLHGQTYSTIELELGRDKKVLGLFKYEGLIAEVDGNLYHLRIKLHKRIRGSQARSGSRAINSIFQNCGIELSLDNLSEEQQLGSWKTTPAILLDLERISTIVSKIEGRTQLAGNPPSYHPLAMMRAAERAVKTTAADKPLPSLLVARKGASVRFGAPPSYFEFARIPLTPHEVEEVFEQVSFTKDLLTASDRDPAAIVRKYRDQAPQEHTTLYNGVGDLFDN